MFFEPTPAMFTAGAADVSSSGGGTEACREVADLVVWRTKFAGREVGRDAEAGTASGFA